MDLTYNHLNLPRLAKLVPYYDQEGGQRNIEWLYDAAGNKLRKTTEWETIDYCEGIEYKGGLLDAIYHAEGRAVPLEGNFLQNYTIRDHLGNTRVVFFSYLDPNNSEELVVIAQAYEYYPFGLFFNAGMEGAPYYPYTYNHKEWNGDYGLDWYDYGARWYDAAVGRWWSGDPMGEKMSSWSTYNYGFDNPLRFIDPTGMAPDDYVYLDTKGNEIGRVKDNNVKQVTIITDENLGKFHMLSEDAKDYKASIAAASTMGITYDMTGVLALYDRSAKDLLPPVVDGETYIDDGTGKPRYDVAAEHGNYLVKGSDGVVKVSNAPDVQGDYEKVILDKPSGGKLGTIHSHPNEGKKGTIHATKGGFSLDDSKKGPSTRDLNQHPPQSGYHNIVVDNQSVYFYKGSQTKNVIKLNKTKL